MDLLQPSDVSQHQKAQPSEYQHTHTHVDETASQPVRDGGSPYALFLRKTYCIRKRHSRFGRAWRTKFHALPHSLVFRETLRHGNQLVVVGESSGSGHAAAERHTDATSSDTTWGHDSVGSHELSLGRWI